MSVALEVDWTAGTLDEPGANGASDQGHPAAAPNDCHLPETDTDPAHDADALDPLERLARHAIAEYEAGRTHTLQPVAAEHGLDLDGGE